MVLAGPRDALQVIKTDFPEFCRAERRFRPQHSLRTLVSPEHAQLTLGPPINLTNTIVVLDTNEQRYRDALTLNFVHVLMLSS